MSSVIAELLEPFVWTAAQPPGRAELEVETQESERDGIRIPRCRHQHSVTKPGILRKGLPSPVNNGRPGNCSACVFARVGVRFGTIVTAAAYLLVFQLVGESLGCKKSLAMTSSGYIRPVALDP